MPETNNTIDLVLLKDIKCKSCGGEIWTPPKQNGEARKKDYCSLKCCQGHHNKIRKAKIESGEIEQPVYKYRYRSAKQRMQRLRNKDKWTFKCDQCGLNFIPTSRSESNPNKFCSKDCRDKGITNPPYSKVYFNKCIECGDQLDTRDSKSICSDKCRDIRSKRIQKKHNELYKGSDKQIAFDHKRNMLRRRKQKPIHCTICNVYFTSFSSKSHTCTIECSKKYQRRYKKSETHERRAKRHGVKYERVNRIDIFNRDNWKCQACGCDTPIEYMGTRNDNAPELDHITPISKGGDHVADNLQCLCLVCNWYKSDTYNDIFLSSVNK